MLLSRILIDPRCKEVRRDLSNPYELHSTLCRAFSLPEEKVQPSCFLWRLEPETTIEGFSKILIQSTKMPIWDRIGIPGWFGTLPDPPVDLTSRLNLDHLQVGQNFRYRLQANPSKMQKGKRLGLLQVIDQERWLSRKGEECGFALPKSSMFDLTGDDGTPRPDVQITQERMLSGKRRDDTTISIFSVSYDGILTITDPMKFRDALEHGVGHGKVFGLGLLSVVPVS